MSKTFLISAISAACFVVVSMSGMPSLAAEKSACKGMAKAQCESASSCGWVKSYKNKSGKTIAAHCRTKAKSASKTKPPAKPKTN